MQRKSDRGAWGFEGQKAPVASPIDDAAPGLLGDATYDRAVPFDQFADCLVAARCLERGRIRQIDEDQREDP